MKDYITKRELLELFVWLELGYIVAAILWVFVIH